MIAAVHGRRLAALIDPVRASRAAALIAALLYLVAAWQIRPQLPGGDEPHYLVITQSLLRDGDLKIENNHLRGDYHEFFFPPLKPDYLQRGVNGEIYSIHAPGLPIVVAPAFALFGYAGVLCFLAIVSGAATGLAWVAVWRTTGDIAASWFGWASVALSVPFVFDAFTVYPDGLGAVLVMAGVFTAVAGRDASPRLLMATGVALAILPWVHTRFALLAISLGIIILAEHWKAADRWRRIAALLAAPVVSTLAWFTFFYTIYGTPNPAAPYAGNMQSALGNVPRGITGLLFDQQFGLLPNAPVFLCAIAGFVPLTRRRPRLAAQLAVVMIPYVVAVAAFYMWWGGHGSPARFLDSILLPMAIPAGVWFSTRGPAGRMLALGSLALAVALTITTAAVGRGALLYNLRDGASLLLVWLSPIVNLPAALPSFFQTGPFGAFWRALVWIAAVLAIGGVGAWLAQRQVRTETLAAGIGLASAAAAMAAASVAWRLNGARPLIDGKAGAALLGALDGDAAQLVIRYRPLRRIDGARVVPLLPLLAPVPQTGRADAPMALIREAPAATYTIEATIAGQAGRLTASIDRQSPPLSTWDLSAARGPWIQTITLLNDAHTLRLDGDRATLASVGMIAIHAARRLPSHERVSDRPAWRSGRYGHATVFLLDGRAYVESAGAWIVGAAFAEFAIAPDPGSPIQLFIRNTAIDNTVVLETADWRQELKLAPREERSFNVPLDHNRPGAVLRVSTSTGTRPADVEAGNQDKRFLGCWIETR